MPAITIDKFDIGIYIQYARRTELIEQVRQQLHITEAGNVPATALIIDLYPKLSELDLLLGVATVTAPWAYFYAPKNFRFQRRSPFAFHRIIPIFGSKQKQEEEEEKLEQCVCETSEEEQEKQVLKSCFKQIRQINDLLQYIGGRIGQFLQG
jgi:hypothetical protein